MRQISPLATQLWPLTRYLPMLLFVGGLGLLILYAAAGKLLVAAIYDGSLTPVLGHLFENRSAHDVAHYHRVLGQRVAYLLAAIGALALALMCLPRSFRHLTTAFFALDFLFIAVDRSFAAVGARPGLFSVTVDGSYPELFQYVKEAWIAAAFVVLYTRRRCPMYLGWSALFLYLLVDDAFMVHEQLGLFLSTHFQFPAVMGLRSKDLGELLVVGTVGAAILGFLAATYRQASPPDRWTTQGLLALLGILVLFGVGLDMAAIALRSDWLGFLEDAGEMLAVSAMAWYVHRRVVDAAARDVDDEEPYAGSPRSRSSPSTR